ncbi:MAG: tRNA lysidine(34) synthetase TilS [Actinomycetaceae bacterium]|nr:tRNA lysidine(34) synthetase TilS [Actinomycetaceae bacterium]
MAGPHRALAATRRAVAAAFRHERIEAGSRVLLAVSGGSDSMALAQAALFVARRQAVVVASMTVDHGWREESADEAATVRGWLEAMGADPAMSVRVDARGSGGPEAAARAARYEALARAARDFGGATVLLGHTADDQAETVLLGLARGSGTRSIAGMPPASHAPGARDVATLRPFLGLRRETLRLALRSEGLAWFDDPTNDPGTAAGGRQHEPHEPQILHGPAQPSRLPLRSALRHHALPALEEDLGPGVVEALARTATLVRADAEALDEIAAAHAERLGPHPPLDDLRAMPRAVRTRILRSLAIAAGARAGELTSWHITHMDELATGGNGRASLDLPGVKVAIGGGRVAFQRTGPAAGR